MLLKEYTEKSIWETKIIFFQNVGYLKVEFESFDKIKVKEKFFPISQGPRWINSEKNNWVVKKSHDILPSNAKGWNFGKLMFLNVD